MTFESIKENPHRLIEKPIWFINNKSHAAPSINLQGHEATPKATTSQYCFFLEQRKYVPI